MKLRNIFILLGIFCSFGATLEWNRNPETNVIGYRVYVGTTPRLYDFVLDVGDELSVQLPTFSNTISYYAVTAYDSDGMESDFSIEVSYPPNSTNSPPTNSLPSLMVVREPSGKPRFSFIAQANVYYVVEISFDLHNWYEYIEVQRDDMGETIIPTYGENQEKVFFRIKYGN